MSPISNSYSTKNEYDMKIGDINVSDFHIVLILEYYTQILAVFDETDAEQKQKQTCCKSTSR